MLITNIQRFSLHDGPGIRTTIFLKGCKLKCPWCSNPENISFLPEKFIKEGKENIYGKKISCDEIFNEIIKDINYYGDNGGVTFSGGEALLQVNDLMPLIEKIKKIGIKIAVETSLFVPEKNLKYIIPYIDTFIVDMKLMDENLCKKTINGDIKQFKSNLELITKYKRIIIRIPMINGYTDSKENIKLITEEIKKYQKSVEIIEIINGHNLGNSKYISLGLNAPKKCNVNDDILIMYKKYIENETGISTIICKI